MLFLGIHLYIIHERERAAKNGTLVHPEYIIPTKPSPSPLAIMSVFKGTAADLPSASLRTPSLVNFCPPLSPNPKQSYSRSARYGFVCSGRGCVSDDDCREGGEGERM